MKAKKSFFMVALMILPNAIFSQSQIQEAWELPLKNDLVTFEYQQEFKNKQKSLKEYLNNANFYNELWQKVNNELSNKGTKLLSNTYYSMLYTPPDGTQFSKKELGKYADTVMSELSIQSLTTNNTQAKILGKRSNLYKITAKVRIIFKDNNKYEMKIRGF